MSDPHGVKHGPSRRTILKGLGAVAGWAALPSAVAAAVRPPADSVDSLGVGPQPQEHEPYPSTWLPPGVRSRFVNDVNGLRVHVLEAGFDGGRRPSVLLLHGFPELAFSWRRIMVPLADAGFHVIAPDQRGYGRTTGQDTSYDGDLPAFRRLNIVRDALGLVSAFGYSSVAGVVGHDFGSPIAAWCAVTRPDVFRSVALMSAPFGGTPTLPFDTADDPPRRSGETGASIFASLAALPRPRKHYQQYYTSREANENMWRAPQGIHAFLRAYYHFKSADWPGNTPHPLAARTAAEWAKMPAYYIMDLAQGMAETVAAEMPTAEEIRANQWLPEADLRVYAHEYGRTGFQGGLQWYRSGGIGTPELELFAGRTIDQPSVFISGASDWGVYQAPGELERMQQEVCTDLRGVHLVDGAGHWVQQEQHRATSELLIQFLRDIG